MKISALLAAPFLCLALAGCNDLAVSVVCPSEPRPSVVLSMFDAAGQPVAHPAQGWYTVGVTTDSLRHHNRGHGATQLAAFGPVGVYELRVLFTGLPELKMPNVVVEAGECGPGTRYLDVQIPLGV